MKHLGPSQEKAGFWPVVAVLVLAAFRSSFSSTSTVTRKSTSTGLEKDNRRAAVKGLLFDLYANVGKHRVVALAAGVTFYSILALFPAIAALVSLYGLFADPSAISLHLGSMSGILPGGAMQVVGDELNRLVSQGSGKLSTTFLIGLGAALWSANAGMKALMDALNLVNDLPEQRGTIKLNAVSLAFTAGIIAFVLLALTGMVVLPMFIGYKDLNFDQLLKIARWPALVAVAAIGLAILYRFGPSRTEPHREWISWGSAFAAAAWLIASLLFTWYAANFASYNKTYGSLGAIIGFMVWIWISTIVVLLGAELDARLGDSRVK